MSYLHTHINATYKNFMQFSPRCTQSESTPKNLVSSFQIDRLLENKLERPQRRHLRDKDLIQAIIYHYDS